MSYYSEAINGTGSGAGLGEFHGFIQRIQNGPDAVALISSFGDVVDFIAYELGVTALNWAGSGSERTFAAGRRGERQPCGLVLAAWR